MRREPERHLVGDEQLRRRRQHAGEREHLLLAARQRARLLAPPLGRGSGTSRAHASSARLALVHAARVNRSCAHRLSRTERCGKRLRDLGHVGEPELADLVRVRAGDVLTVERDRARARRARRPRSRRRATTCPRHWRRARPSRIPAHVERHAEQRARLAVRDLEVADLEQRMCRCVRVVGSVTVVMRRPRPTRRVRRSRRPALRCCCGLSSGVPVDEQLAEVEHRDTVSDSASTNSTLCSTSTSAVPRSSRTRRSASPSCSVSWTSRPDDGSSSSITDGSDGERHAPTSTRRPVPSGTDTAGRSATDVSPRRSRTSATVSSSPVPVVRPCRGHRGRIPGDSGVLLGPVAQRRGARAR